MQTCEVEARGPTGRKLKVRAFIDEGADSSSITARVAKILQLEPLEESVEVTAFANAKEQVFKIANFTLSSYLKRDWSLPVSAIILEKIMGLQPRQDATDIKRLVEAQGLTPADSQFEKPGRIDVLLGADVIPFIQTKDGSASSIIARNTVFGHVFLGTYDSTPSSIPIMSNIQVVSSSVVSSSVVIKTTDDSLSRAVTKFWEAEEPPVRKQTLSAEEKRVQDEYAITHNFIPNAGRYEVTLPRKIGDWRLGESRGRALQRFYSNERSLRRNGTWGEFQRVVAEYLELGHGSSLHTRRVSSACK